MAIAAAPAFDRIIARIMQKTGECTCLAAQNLMLISFCLAPRVQQNWGVRRYAGVSLITPP
jgi:hypothetical protein